MQKKQLLRKALTTLKIHYRTAIGIVLLVIMGAYIVIQYVFQPNDMLYIAVAGPMSTEDGKAMVRGIKLALEEANQKGGIDGKKIQSGLKIAIFSGR